MAAGSLRNPAGIQPWFDRILVNVCRDRLRRSRVVRFVPITEAVERASQDPYDRLVRDHDALDALNALDPDLRIAVLLRYWADLKVDDIAACLGWPAGTVKTRLRRAMDQIRTKLTDTTAAEATR
jgi:RNA polymerase sigma factor (sigma-70 family)